MHDSNLSTYMDFASHLPNLTVATHFTNLSSQSSSPTVHLSTFLPFPSGLDPFGRVFTLLHLFVLLTIARELATVLIAKNQCTRRAARSGCHLACVILPLRLPVKGR
eukprot:COSAG01_NODE_8146_length_2904_cov_10.815686_8_plen_107_part_00